MADGGSAETAAQEVEEEVAEEVAAGEAVSSGQEFPAGIWSIFHLLKIGPLFLSTGSTHADHSLSL